MKKMDEIKVLRDPIHGYIHVEYQVIWDIINAKEFQRLRRIHQLGFNHYVYHCAEHSRFSHSLGVYEIVANMCNEVQDINESLSEYDKVCVMLAGLLHDIGHGPFSHAFEAVFNRSHEYYSELIITSDSDINKILMRYDINLVNDIVKILKKIHPNVILNQMISGQLDADRMDYLLRDAYFTGTSYGNFDIQRVIRTIRIVDNHLVIKESGIHTIEDYIIARYHMYWQVYYHPIVRSAEGMLSKLFERIKEVNKTRAVLKDIDFFSNLINDELSYKDHYYLDDCSLQYVFNLLMKDEDKIIATLAQNLLERHLFAYEQYSDEVINNKMKEYNKSGIDYRYYMFVDKSIQRPYVPYLENSAENIWVLKEKGEVVELSTISILVDAITKGKVKEDKKIFYIV